jgi:hypothetical protein
MVNPPSVYGEWLPFQNANLPSGRYLTSFKDIQASHAHRIQFPLEFSLRFNNFIARMSQNRIKINMLPQPLPLAKRREI